MGRTTHMTNRFSPRPNRSTPSSDPPSAPAPRDRQPLDRPLALSVQLKLIEADLAEVQVVEGEVALLIDPIFEMACDAAREGLADRDAGRQTVQWSELWPQEPPWPADLVDQQGRRSA